MDNKIRPIYGLTEAQMVNVYRDVNKYYIIEDILDYIDDNNVIDPSEDHKVDLDYIANCYVLKAMKSIPSEDTIKMVTDQWFKRNASKFKTLHGKLVVAGAPHD